MLLHLHYHMGVLIFKMKKLNSIQKQIQGQGIINYGGWGIATLANVLVNGAIGVTTNSLNIANSIKQASKNSNLIYKNPLSTKYNFF